MVNTQQILNGKVLEVKRLATETEKEDVEKLRNKESSGEKESRTVTVSGLPEGSTENSVHIHFQKRKNGGGEVEEVEMLGEGKAMVTFEDPRGRLKFSITVMHYDSKHEQDRLPIVCRLVDFVNVLFSITSRCQGLTASLSLLSDVLN